MPTSVDLEETTPPPAPDDGSFCATPRNNEVHRSIRLRLRMETASQHSALEARLPVLDPDLAVDVYQNLIARFWGFYRPLEQRLLTVAPRLLRSCEYASRFKTPLLVRDLECFGRLPGTLSQCRGLPELASLPKVLGCLYVIEGSTLGGQVISRYLKIYLGLTRESGAAFFTGYGASSARRWRAFGGFLTDTADALDCDELIVSGAVQTFDAFNNWLAPT
jgi:heme oxygenase